MNQITRSTLDASIQKQPVANQKLTFGAENTARQPEENEGLRKVAQEFEAIFTNYIMKTMRESVPKSGLMGESKDLEFFTGMMDTEVANRASKGRGTGLADIIYKQLVQRHGDLKELPNLRGKAALPFLPDQVNTRMYTQVPRSDGVTVSVRLKRLDPIIQRAATEVGVDPALIRSVIAQESGGKPYAVSSRGAKGLMQLMGETAREMGVQNIFDPTQNVTGGTRYLKQLLYRYDNDLELSLAAYNAGPTAVDRYQGVPPYKETQEYVNRVLNMFRAEK